mgnify:CR=1 FL=1
MEIWELGKKINSTLLPIAILSGALVYLKVEVSTLILAIIIFSIVYVLIWHEIRIRKIEKGGN